jgi:hypothetical protein
MDSPKRLEKESTEYAYKDWNLTEKRWMGLWSSPQLILMS